MPKRNPSKLDELLARVIVLDRSVLQLRAEIAALRELLLQHHSDPEHAPSAMEQLHQAIRDSELATLEQTAEEQLQTTLAALREADRISPKPGK